MSIMAALIAVVVLASVVLHWVIRGFLLASVLVTAICVGIAAFVFESRHPTTGGASMASIALLTIGIGAFIGAVIVGKAVRWLRSRLRQGTK
jgi:hypothetical protein